MGSDAAATASFRAAGVGVGLDVYRQAQVVAVFFPIRGELDPLVMADLAESRGKRFVLPRSHVESRELTFHLSDCDPPMGQFGCAAKIRAALTPGAYGILEPSGDQVDLAEIDLILVPALAYDRRGHRLGYGAGYYDRLLRTLRQTLDEGCTWGLGYDWQLVESLPSQPHDVPLEMVLTPTEAVRCTDR